jgi:ribosomal protein S18 acetylase RimI-like enzyme
MWFRRIPGIPLTMTDYSQSGSGFSLKARLTPWDREVLGFPVAAITELEISDDADFKNVFDDFRQWLDAHHVGLVSCRLAQDKLKEASALEYEGFRFIETVLHPVHERLEAVGSDDGQIIISEAESQDVETIAGIAERSFGHERFHADPRIDNAKANRRYANWVSNTSADGNQQLLKITEGGNLVAFFIVERVSPNKIYWHLTAVSPEYQGRGYGRRVWLAMLNRHKQDGIESVSTTISARNVPALNLYSSLNFRFLPPEMTFHWWNG